MYELKAFKRKKLIKLTLFCTYLNLRTSECLFGKNKEIPPKWPQAFVDCDYNIFRQSAICKYVVYFINWLRKYANGGKIYFSNRTRSVISWPLCDGSPCPSTMLESRSCVVTDVISCEFTDWSNWTACSNDCGEGVVIRSRSMITPAYCGGSCENELTYEERVCESYTAMQDCEVNKWLHCWLLEPFSLNQIIYDWKLSEIHIQCHITVSAS